MSNGDHQHPVGENGFSDGEEHHVDVHQPLFIDVGHGAPEQPVHVNVNAEAHEMLLLQVRCKEAPGRINGGDHPAAPPALDAQNSIEVSSASTASTYLLTSSASGNQPDAGVPRPGTSTPQPFQPQATSSLNKSLDVLEESSELSELTSSSGPEGAVVMSNLRRRSREEDGDRRRGQRDEEIERGRRHGEEHDRGRREESETTALLPSRPDSAQVRRQRLQAYAPYLRWTSYWLALVFLLPIPVFFLWNAGFISTEALIAISIILVFFAFLPCILAKRN